MTHRVGVVVRVNDDAIGGPRDDARRSVVPVVHVEQDVHAARRRTGSRRQKSVVY